LQGARLTYVTAAEMLNIAVAWQVYELTHQPLALGLVGLMQFIPGVLLALPAGHAADRFDRRLVLLLSNVAYAVCAGLLLWISLSGVHSVLPIYLVLILLGAIRTFSAPAAQALLPQIVPAEHFQNAVAWSSSFFMVATILGPALGGIFYAIARGPQLAYAVSLAMYIAVVVVIAMMHVRTGRMETKATSMETVLAGVKYVWKEKAILGSISLDLFAVLLGGSVALLPVYADKILHVGPVGLGILRSAPAVGAGVMAVALAYRPIRRRAGKLMFFCVFLFGVSTIVFGISRSFWLSLLFLTILGASDMVSVVVRSTLVQVTTPGAMRGRVSAVNMLFIGASNEFGEFESGVTAHWFGTVPAVVIGGVGTLIVVAAWWFLFPGLRDVDDLSNIKRTE